MAQQVKDQALSLQWFRSLLWCRFDPWPRNFCMPRMPPKKKKKKKKKRKREKKKKKKKKKKKEDEENRRSLGLS